MNRYYLLISIITVSFITILEPLPVYARHPLQDRGVELAREGRLDESLSIFERAVCETGNDPSVTADYIVVLNWVGRHDDAIAKYNALPQDYDPPAYLLNAVAGSLHITGASDDAIVLYRRILDTNPGDTDALDGLIGTYIDLGRYADARQFIRLQMVKTPNDGYSLKLQLARVLTVEGKIAEAEAVYRELSYTDPSDIRVNRGFAAILIDQGRYNESELYVNRVLEHNPDDYDALFQKAAILESRENYMGAYTIYRRLVTLHPDSRASRNLMYRCLLYLGANSLVREMLESSGDEIDPELVAMLMGNEAMVAVRWGEDERALDLTERNMRWLADSPLSDNVQKNLEYRAQYDRMQALRNTGSYNEVIGLYEKLLDDGVDMPHYVIRTAADAYRALKQLTDAERLYRLVYEDSGDIDAGIALMRTLSDLGQYDKASELLDDIGNQVEPVIVTDGIERPNPRQNDVAVLRGMLLLYRDRLGDGIDYFEDIRHSAPYNNEIRSGLATAYLWRGWPRKALQEYSIANRIEPDNLYVTAGLLRAMNQNDGGREARRLADDLAQKHPGNDTVERLVHDFSVQDKAVISGGGGVIQEDPGVEASYWSARIDQPLLPWRKIYGEHVRRDYEHNDFTETIERGVLGLDWRLGRDWWFGAAYSVDPDSENGGFSTSLSYTPYDILTFGAFYESYSLAVPLRARVRGIESEEYSMNFRIRTSEMFSLESAVSYFQLSDDNDHTSAQIRLDRRVTTGPRWKTWIRIEGYGLKNSSQNVPYFSPPSLYQAYLVPNIEHTWYRRYGKAVTDRFYGGVGIQKQEDYDELVVWYLRYDQQYRLSDTFAFNVGVTYSRQNYDGEDTDVLNVYAGTQVGLW